MNKSLLLSIALSWVAGIVFAPPARAEPPDAVRAKALAVLKSSAPLEQKAAACKDLARVGDTSCVPVLARMLGDEKLSHLARYALEAIPDTSADEALRAALDTLSGALLSGIISSVGTRRDSAAVGQLARHLGDRDSDVVRTAAIALGRIGTATAGKALLGAMKNATGENLSKICDGLLICGASLAAHDRPREAAALYDGMLAQDPPARFRAAALRGAVLCDPSGGTKRFRGMIRDNDYCIFAMALRVAAEVKDRGITDVLVSEIGNLPADRVVPVIKILGQRGDRAALPLLLEMTKKAEREVRFEAIRALAEIGDASALPVLVELVKDKDGAVHWAAVFALTGLPGAQVDAAIVKILEGPDRTLKLPMLEIAGQRRIAGALPALLKAMSDPDLSIRIAAARNYGELAGAGGIPMLLDMLMKSTDVGEMGLYERILGSVCLAASDKGACAGKLVDALSRARPAVKPALLRTLRVTGGPEALRAVRGAVDDTNKEIHTAALRELDEWTSPDAAPVLLELAKNSGEPGDKLAALRGYLGIALQESVAAPDKLAICRQAAPMTRRPEEKRMLLGALGRVASAASLDLVVPYLDDATVKSDAVATVLTIAEKRKKNEHSGAAKAALEKVLRAAADDPAVVKRAEELLKQMVDEK
jgi:HEAT repeat protein